MNNKEPAPISKPAQAPAALSLPASAGVAPISDSSAETDDSNVEITTTDTSNTRESATVVKSSLRKQTTINNFYVKRPLQIIRTNLKAHNPKKRLHTNTHTHHTETYGYDTRREIIGFCSPPQPLSFSSKEGHLRSPFSV